jgi:hypothetical protein
MQAKLLDSSGEAWVSAFNEQAETLLAVSADNLSEMRSQVIRFPIYNLKHVSYKWTGKRLHVHSQIC